MTTVQKWAVMFTNWHVSYLHYSSLLRHAETTNIPPTNHEAIFTVPEVNVVLTTASYDLASWNDLYLVVWNILQRYLEENQIAVAIQMIDCGKSPM
jgi:hypothetical protein